MAVAVVMAGLLVAADGPAAQAPPGAAALLDPANKGVVWSDIRSAGHVRPAPQDAPRDRPDFYDDGSGCQVGVGDPTPKVCASGDRDGTRTVMLVGDSKIAQWQTAFSDLGERHHWRVLATTKRSCPFTDASITGGGKVLEDCREWGRTTLEDVLRARPDVVITSQRFDTALPPGRSDGHDRTQDAMIAGLTSFWGRLERADIPVVVLLDNPSPTTHPVYACVQEHPDAVDRCAYRLGPAAQDSAAPVQRRAAAQAPGVRVMDMTATVCPDDGRCPAVIGGVLVNRSGSHLTKTFVVSAEAQMSSELAGSTDGLFGTR